MFYRHRQVLAKHTPLRWCVFPAAYLAYALIRGAMLGSYPYPFIDVLAIGYMRVAINSIGLLVLFLALGYSVLGLSRLAGVRQGR